MAPLPCLPVPLSPLFPEKTEQKVKYLIAFKIMSNIYWGSSLAVTTNCKPWSCYKSYQCRTHERDQPDLGTWLAGLFYSPQNGILKFHVETGKGNGDQEMAKKYQKENESFRISSNGVRNVSENVSTKSWVPVLKGRKKTAYRP